MIYARFPSFFGLGLEDSHVPTFWLLLRTTADASSKGADLEGMQGGVDKNEVLELSALSSEYVYMYMCIYIYVNLCMYIYIYMYM